MRAALSRITLERAIQVAIVATIVTAVLAAGALLSWLEIARRLRWPALALLLALSLAYALRRRGGPKPTAAYAMASVLVALALISAFWSVQARTTAAHGIALAVLFAACGALSYATAGRPQAVRRLLDAVLAAAGVVSVGGLLVLLFRHDRAIQPATTALPLRYQGLGGGPNTATMMLAVAVPLALDAAAGPRRVLGRAIGVLILALLVGSIVASGSRGALVSAFVGTLAYVLIRIPTLRGRATAAAAVVALFALAVGATRVPQPLPPGSPNPPTAYVAYDPFPPDVHARPPYADANILWRLQDDIGRPAFGVADTHRRPRTLLGTSGRVEAWTGAVEQATRRPLLGYGFGAEGRVFVDRYVNFNSGTPENSYVGLFLQLGVGGLLTFLVLVAYLVGRTVRSLRGLHNAQRFVVAASGGALAAGLALAFFQSYIYAVGNNATAAVWICGFLLAAATTTPRGAECA